MNLGLKTKPILELEPWNGVGRVMNASPLIRCISKLFALQNGIPISLSRALWNTPPSSAGKIEITKAMTATGPTGKDLEGFLKTNGDCRARTILSPNNLTDLIDYPSLLEGTSEDQYDYKNSSVSLWVSSPPVRACSDWRRPSGSRWTFTQATGKFYCDLPGGTLQISEVVSCPTRQGNYGCEAMLANKE